MQATDRDLWRRLEALELDDPTASLTFTRRLARENGWDVPYATRVVDEYKRFVFLAMTAGHQVTPSDEVDQAWHLHLTYTRSYWGELCGEVLGRPLHHGPTKGGAAEGQRFEGQYDATLASYRDAFDEEPPADIWPPSVVRFGEAKDFVRVNRQRVWLVPKPWGKRRSISYAAGFIGLGVGAPMLGAGSEGAVAMLIVGVVTVVFLSVFASAIGSGKQKRRRRRKNDDGSGCGTAGGWFGDSGSSGCNSDSGCAASGCGSSGCGGGGCGGGD